MRTRPIKLNERVDILKKLGTLKKNLKTQAIARRRFIDLVLEKSNSSPPLGKLQPVRI